jgi:hypothetical protein
MGEGRSHERETIEFHEGRLVWGDALLVLIAAEAAGDPRVAQAVFAQADSDRGDTSTEYGGALAPGDAGRFSALSFPPRAAQRSGDNRFVASPEMLSGGATALFHYHFHVRSANEREFAGPSDGDLDYAERFGRSCLVFTAIGDDVLGLDYYQPDRAVIDLGEVRRPAKAGAPGDGGGAGGR